MIIAPNYSDPSAIAEELLVNKLTAQEERLNDLYEELRAVKADIHRIKTETKAERWYNLRDLLGTCLVEDLSKESPRDLLGDYENNRR